MKRHKKKKGQEYATHAIKQQRKSFPKLENDLESTTTKDEEKKDKRFKGKSGQPSGQMKITEQAKI